MFTFKKIYLSVQDLQHDAETAVNDEPALVVQSLNKQNERGESHKD